MKKSTFFKRLIDLEMMNENGGITLRIKGVKDWPQDLDIENWEIDSVSPGDEDDEKGEGYVSGYAGGDWQDAARFTILIPATGKPHCKMFDDPSCFAGKNIYKELKSLVKKELKEAQFKTKKRKIARSYEERKRLANRKRFNESEEYEYQILEPAEIKSLDELRTAVRETPESMGKDDEWVEWMTYAINLGRKYLGDNARYDLGDDSHFYEAFENKLEIDPYQTYSSQSIDKMISVRLACI